MQGLLEFTAKFESTLLSVMQMRTCKQAPSDKQATPHVKHKPQPCRLDLCHKKKKSLTNLHDKRKDGVELSRQNYLC